MHFIWYFFYGWYFEYMYVFVKLYAIVPFCWVICNLLNNFIQNTYFIVCFISTMLHLYKNGIEDKYDIFSYRNMCNMAPQRKSKFYRFRLHHIVIYLKKTLINCIIKSYLNIKYIVIICRVTTNAPHVDCFHTDSPFFIHWIRNLKVLYLSLFCVHLRNLVTVLVIFLFNQLNLTKKNLIF